MENNQKGEEKRTKNIAYKNEKEAIIGNLRESGTLSPNRTVVTDYSSGFEMLAINLIHQLIVNVRLPRHIKNPRELMNEQKRMSLKYGFLCFGCVLNGNRSWKKKEKGEGYI